MTSLTTEKTEENKLYNTPKEELRIPFITEIQRFSLQDGPGIRTTVFMKGCPLKCPWCHNPETQNPKREIYLYSEKCVGCGRCAEVCPTKATSISFETDKAGTLSFNRSKCIACFKCVDVCLKQARTIVGQILSMDEIIQEAVADNIFYEHTGGGITLSGGEPLLFPEFTLEISKRLKSRKELIHIAIETSCFAEWRNIKPLLPYIDLFIVDIKTLNPEKHKTVVGCSIDVVLKNIERLLENHANTRIHLPIIPGFNNTEEDYEAYLQYFSRFTKSFMGVDILSFHCYAQGKYTFLGRQDTYQFSGVEDLPQQELLPFARELKKMGIDATIGGSVGLGDVKRKNPPTKP